jgi:hypothetical protein
MLPGVNLLTVQLGHGAFTAFPQHLDETEPLGVAGKCRDSDPRGRDCTERPEQICQIAIRGAFGQVAHM